MRENTRHKRGIVIGVLGAIVLLLLTVIVVLPLTSGRDPTGLGVRMGLISPPAASGDPSLDTVIEDLLSANDQIVEPPAPKDSSVPSEPIPLPNPAISQDESTPPRTDTIRVKLAYDEGTEVKAVMAKSKAIVYSWKVEGGSVYVDFHGHDPKRSKNFWVRYVEAGKEDGVTGGNGSLVAPFSGEHGWYWLNLSQEPVTIELTVTGYHEKLVDHGIIK